MAVKLSKVTVRAMSSLRGKRDRENMQRNCLKNRCFMTGQSAATQLKKICDRV